MTRVFLITGASQGIGRGIAESLAAPGVEIGLCGSKPSARLTQACENVRARGAEATALTGDIADPAVPQALVESLLESFGRLDCLVINAAERSLSPLVETPLDTWDRDFDVNVRASWLLAVAAHDALRSSRGSIISIGSVSAVMPHPGMGAYSATKAAQEMLTRQFAVEWAGDGIRANSVHPGFVVTEKTAEFYRDENLRATRIAMVPSGRLATVADVAGVVGFLSEPRSAYCTGQSLTVDGGLLDSLFQRDPRTAAKEGV